MLGGGYRERWRRRMRSGVINISLFIRIYDELNCVFEEFCLYRNKW